MSQAKRYREDYNKKLKAREADELVWFEEKLDMVEQKNHERKFRFMVFGGGIFTALLLLIWVILRSRWLTIDIPSIGLVAIGAVISYIGLQFGILIEVITRR